MKSAVEINVNKPASEITHRGSTGLRTVLIIGIGLSAVKALWVRIVCQESRHTLCGLLIIS